MGNILLTGGAGYIGSNVALSLINKNYEVTILDSLVTGNKILIPKEAKFIECDIADKDKVTSVLMSNKYHALMHFAGLIKVEESILKPKKYLENNFNKSRIFFDTCIQNGLNNLIFSSSASVYGNTSIYPVKEDNVLTPLNPYANSKILTENYLQELSYRKKINVIILRYFNVAGADPYLRSGLISENPTHLIKIASEVAVKKRNDIVIYGDDYPTSDGTTIRDFIHVSDLAQVHILSLDYLLKNSLSLTMNCGYGYGYSVKQILDKMNTILDTPINIKIGNRRKGDAVSLIANIDKISKILKWKPKFNKLEDILKTSINWEKKLLDEKI